LPRPARPARRAAGVPSPSTMAAHRARGWRRWPTSANSSALEVAVDGAGGDASLLGHRGVVPAARQPGTGGPRMRAGVLGGFDWESAPVDHGGPNRSGSAANEPQFIPVNARKGGWPAISPV
jgi:hypothetical protein